MSIINNMLKDLEKRKGNNNDNTLDNDNIHVSNDKSKATNPIKVILPILTVVALSFLVWGYINDNEFIEDAIYDLQEMLNPTEVTIARPIQTPQITPKKIIAQQAVKTAEQPDIIVKKQPTPKTIARAIPKPTPIAKLNTTPKPIVKEKPALTNNAQIPAIQNIRYYSDGNIARLVIDSTKDINQSVKRIYSGNNQVRYEFDAKGIANQAVTNNHSDKVIENLSIKDQGDKTILSYRTLVSTTSKYHQLKPVSNPYYRFVIEIRPDKNQTNPIKAEAKNSVKLVNEKNLAVSRWFHLAQIQYKKGQLPKAKNNLRKLLKNDPYHVQAYQLLANIYIQNGQAIDAKKILKGGFQYTKNSKIALLYAQLLAQAKQQKQALKILQQVKQNNDTTEFLSVKAALLQQTHQHAQATSDYLTLLERDSNIGKWWLALALSLEAEEKTVQAKHAYEEAITKPDITSALRQYAKKRLKRL